MNIRIGRVAQWIERQSSRAKHDSRALLYEGRSFDAIRRELMVERSSRSAPAKSFSLELNLELNFELFSELFSKIKNMGVSVNGRPPRRHRGNLGSTPSISTNSGHRIMAVWEAVDLLISVRVRVSRSIQ